MSLRIIALSMAVLFSFPSIAAAHNATPRERALAKQVQALKKSNKALRAQLATTRRSLTNTTTELDEVERKRQEIEAQFSTMRILLEDKAAKVMSLEGDLTSKTNDLAVANSSVVTLTNERNAAHSERDTARAERDSAREAATWCGGLSNWNYSYTFEWIFGHILGCAKNTLNGNGFTSTFQTEGDPNAEQGSYTERYIFTRTRTW